MDFEPRHLRALLAVVEQGSFNRAAVAVGLTQPAISKSIAILERVAGTSLFVRGARGASLTAAGEVVARAAVNSLALAQDAKDELAALARGCRGRLRIGATPSAMLGLVPLACAKLTKVEGPLDLTVREGLDAELLPALERGEIDLLVGPTADLQSAVSHIQEGVLLEESVCIGVHRQHTLATRASVRLDDLDEYSWVLPSPGSRFHALIEAALLASAIAWPQDVISTSSLPAQELLALHSDRLLLCTEIQHIARTTNLAIIPIENGPKRRFGWRRLKNPQPSLSLLNMIAQLEDIVDLNVRR